MATASVAVALLVTLSLHHPPIFIPAIQLSAWYGGVGPGLLAGVLSILGSIFYLSATRFPTRPVGLGDAPYLFAVSLSALLVAWVVAKQRRIADALRQARDELRTRMRDLARTDEQLRAEIVERERAETELRQQASLLDLTHDAVFVRDVDDVITYWSRGAAERYGWSSEEAVESYAPDGTIVYATPAAAAATSAAAPAPAPPPPTHP